jgi:hypothetical protein
MLLDRPDLVGKELFVYVESQNADFVVGSYSLVGRGTFVPEPAALSLLVMAAIGSLLAHQRNFRARPASKCS